MTKLISYTTAAVLLGTSAMADVTARQVWDDYKAYMQSFGYTMQATESTSGDRLSVSDITMSMDFPDGSGNFAMSLAGFDLIDQSGSVLITMPTSVPISGTFTPPTGESVAFNLDYQSEGLEIEVTGDPDDMLYAYSATANVIELKDVIVDGGEIPFGVAKARVSVDDISGTTSVKLGEMRDMVQKGTFGRIAYDVRVNDPNSDDNFVAAGSLDGLTFDGGALVPLEMDTTDPLGLFKAGFAMEGVFETGAGKTEFATIADGNSTSGTSTSDGGTIGVSMDGEHLRYLIGSQGLAVNIAGATIPVPISFNAAEIGLNLLFPTASTDEPRDFELGLLFGDFEVSELIWSMFDPGGQLPHDPATILIDLVGQARMLVDIMDPEAMAAAAMAGPPAELHALEINEVLVSAAGAELNGKGSLTFDNADLATFGGLPKPEGAIDLDIKGANGLIDTLIAMGLLPQEQAMGARMMMSMFAVPQGDDHLVSKIEFNDQGHVLANGQRLR